MNDEKAPDASPETPPTNSESDFASSSDQWLDAYFGDHYLEIYRDGGLLPGELTVSEIGVVQRYLPPKRGPLLDVACGYGRHAIPLACMGYQVTGLERNELFIESARRETAEVWNETLGEEEAAALHPPEFIVGDMTAMPFQDESFDSAALLFNSLGYFGAREAYILARQGQQNAPAPPKDDPNLAVLSEIHRILRPGGRAVIDVANPEPLISLIEESPYMVQTTDRYRIDETFEYCREAGVLRNETVFTVNDEESHTGYFLRLYSEEELKTLIAAAGLETLAVLGDYDDEPLDAESSRLIAVVGRA